MKVSIVALLLSASFVSAALAHTHPNDPNLGPSNVSPWAQAELNRAKELGLLPQGYYLGEDYRVPITRGQFTTLVLTWLAVQQHCDLQSFCGMVSLHLGEKSETGKLESVFTDISGDSSDVTHNLLAYYLGIVKGREDGRFDPDGQITRQEAATVAWQLENPQFSQDEKTFLCSVRLPEDAHTQEGKLAHSKGIYPICVDVETGRYQHQVEPLP